jgi:hypothetical protein
MAKIMGLDGLTPAQVEAEVQRGGKFVYYSYVVSILVLTFRRNSDVHFVRSHESAVVKGLPYTLLKIADFHAELWPKAMRTLLTLVAGWWGFPWGLIRTPIAIVSNLSGGTDVTRQVMWSVMNAQPVSIPADSGGNGGRGNSW